MTEYSWTTIRDEATAVFGEGPNAELEAELLPVFRRRPAALAAIVTGAIEDVRAGRVRAGWAVVRTKARALDAPEAVATDETGEAAKRDKVRAAALARVHNIGHEYPSESEFQEDLFGEHGIFKRWPELEDEVMREWRQAQAAA